MPRKNRDQKSTHSKRQPTGKIAKATRDMPADADAGGDAWRLSPTKKADEVYPLKLTQQQRYSLIHCTRIKNKITERLKAAGAGTQVVGVTRKELDHLCEEIATAAVFVPNSDKKRLVAALRKVTELVAADGGGLSEEGLPDIRKTAPKDGKVIYQFKITLLEIKPAIWRRIQVPEGTLADLHEYIQAAFGWWNYHMHQFQIDGECYGPVAPDELDFGLEMRDEAEVTLGKLIPKSGRASRWVYEYDFGDDWRHAVQFEGFAPVVPKAKYPLCIEGQRACPPEDCGGLWGYTNYLDAIRDPQHEQHEEMLEWRGPFDPEAFNAKSATKEMKKVR